MTEYDLIRNNERPEYHVEYQQRVLTYQLTPSISPYIEAATILGGDDPPGAGRNSRRGRTLRAIEEFLDRLRLECRDHRPLRPDYLVVGLAKRF